MSILIDETTRVLVQGFTGDKATFHAKEMLAYGTKIVGGVTPSIPASSPIVRGPPNTSTDNAERRGAETPVARSSCASRRRR